MTLNARELARTSEELHENLRRSGLTRDEVRTDLGFSTARLEATLGIRPESDPVDVWLLRDYLELALRDQGAEPLPYATLTEASRASAERWFSLATPPRHVFVI